MRQKCARNASKIRQKCSKMGLVLLGREERSEMRQKCVENASKMRGTPSGENTFWTIPRIQDCENDGLVQDQFVGKSSRIATWCRLARHGNSD